MSGRKGRTVLEVATGKAPAKRAKPRFSRQRA
mgnify:CR=1 FL=1